MKQSSSIQPDPIPGPDYDPMDRLVQDVQNIETFLSYLALHSQDIDYLNAHLPGILHLRRTIAQQLDKLVDEPYAYPSSRIQMLHADNEKIFTLVEGVVGEMISKEMPKFKKMLKAAEDTLAAFEDRLTP